jgi:hypothetical protein
LKIKCIVRRLFENQSDCARTTAIEQLQAGFDENTKRLSELIRNVSYEEKIEMAAQSCLPEQIIEELAHDDADVRYALAESVQTPVDTLTRLAQDGSAYVAERAVRTMIWIYYMRFCLEDLLIQTLQMKQEEVLEAAAMRHAAQPNNQSSIYENMLIYEQRTDKEAIGWLVKVAEHANTQPDVLDRLSQHQAPDVRIAVADNPSTEVAILHRLATDENADVRYALAENHNVEQTVLLILMGDDNPFVAQRAQKTLLRVRQGLLAPEKFTPRERPSKRRARM